MAGADVSAWVTTPMPLVTFANVPTGCFSFQSSTIFCRSDCWGAEALLREVIAVIRLRRVWDIKRRFGAGTLQRNNLKIVQLPFGMQFLLSVFYHRTDLFMIQRY